MIDKAFYASRVNIWFIDEDQAVTKYDYLTIDKIKQYAHKYDSEIIEAKELSLTSQFRCMGGQEYISFVNQFLGYEEISTKKYKPKNYDFRIFDTPVHMTLCRKVYHAVDIIASKELSHGCRIADIAFGKHVVAAASHIAHVSKISGIGQLVKVDNPVVGIFVDKQPHHMVAYKTGAAGDEYISLKRCHRRCIMIYRLLMLR